jgi:hypothetical protein
VTFQHLVAIKVHSEVGSLYQNLFQSHSSWKVNIQHSFPDHHDLETECYFAAAIGHFIASLTRAKNESNDAFDNKTENCVAWFFLFHSIHQRWSNGLLWFE